MADVDLPSLAGAAANPLSGGRWQVGTFVAACRPGGAALPADVDDFASARTDANELWLTLARDIAGPVNRLRIDP